MSARPAGTHELVPLSAEELRRRREAAGLSTSTLAALLGVSRALVKNWEAGRGGIHPGRLADIHRVLAAQAPAEVKPMPGQELRAIREGAGLSQDELARMLGVTQQAIAGWEAAVVPADRCEVLQQAAVAPSFPGGVLRAERKRAGLKQTQLAAAVGVTQSRVSLWELGDQLIPAAEWAPIRQGLAGVAVPAARQRPVTAEELRDGRHALNWSQGQLAEAVGVKKSAVGAWEAKIKPIPAQYWPRIREVLATSAPAPRRDRVAEALARVRTALEQASDGLCRRELTERVPEPEPNVREAIRRGLEEDLIHERPVKRERGDGVIRYLPALFAGPEPQEQPQIDRLSAVVDEVVETVRVKPGRSRRAIAQDDRVKHDRHIAEKAIDRACREGRILRREVANRSGRGPLTLTALFVPEAAPGPAERMDGSVVRKLREKLLIGQGDFARRLGVSAPTLREWERSEAPGAWRDVIEALVVQKADGDPLERAEAHLAAARAARSDLDRRIIDYIRDHPGTARWGALSGSLRPVERRRLAGRLERLVSEGKLERVGADADGAGDRLPFRLPRVAA